MNDSTLNPPSAAVTIHDANNSISTITGSESVNTPPTITSPIPYSNVRIDETTWNQRIQDLGCSKNEMPHKSYRSKQIPPYGADKIYYYHLSSIAIDYIASFKEHPEEWTRIPHNITNVKAKIIEIILKLRNKTNKENFTLDQSRILGMLHNQWAGLKPPPNITDSDKLRVLGLIMTRPENFYILEKLSEGLSVVLFRFISYLIMLSNFICVINDIL